MGARTLEQGLSFDTPFGPSPEFTLFETAAGRRCLSVRLHGWRDGVSRGQSSRQVFSVFQQAGVSRIISEAGVGSLNTLLDPRDIVIPDDYVDLTTDRGTQTVAGGNLLIMRDPVCSSISRELVVAAEAHAGGRVYSRGVCVVTEGPRFESRAEIQAIRHMGDVVGQSMCPEVWLARDIGACYAALYIVVNYGEGIITDWDHDLLGSIYRDDAVAQSRMILEALDAVDESDGCGCGELRKPTLL